MKSVLEITVTATPGTVTNVDVTMAVFAVATSCSVFYHKNTTTANYS